MSTDAFLRCPFLLSRCYTAVCTQHSPPRALHAASRTNTPAHAVRTSANHTHPILMPFVVRRPPRIAWSKVSSADIERYRHLVSCSITTLPIFLGYRLWEDAGHPSSGVLNTKTRYCNKKLNVATSAHTSTTDSLEYSTLMVVVTKL